MGALSSTLFEALTDALYRRIAAAVITNATDMLDSNAEGGLAEYIDANSTDPLLQAALLDEAADIDRQILAANYQAYVNWALGNAQWKTAMESIIDYVKSDAGGDNASLRAYCSDADASVHPLISELARIVTSEAVFTSSSVAIGPIHPLMKTVAFDRVFTGTLGSLVDDTTDAASTATADVALFAADDDVLVLGSRHEFSYILCDLSTAADADCAIDAYYWNGNAWTALSITDSTTGFSVNDGMITFTAPDDWTPCHKDNQGTPAVFHDDAEEELYYVMLQRTNAAAITPPVATWFQTIPEAVLIGSNLYGVDQPPLAVVQVTDTNTATVTVIQQPEPSRFEKPGTANDALRLRAITNFSNNITFTLGYTDQDGNAATEAQTVWSTPAAGDIKTLALDNGDTAIQTVAAATCAITTAATAGVFVIEVGDYSRAIRAL
jgi:hypothetical protein